MQTSTYRSLTANLPKRISKSIHTLGRAETEPQCRVVKTTSGWGVVSQRSWVPQQTVIRANVLYTSNEPHSHTLQVGHRLHAVLGLPARFLNHSCDGNLTISNSSLTTVTFVARRSIAIGEQLTFDYETSEEWMDTPFDCQCQSSNCRGTIRGFLYRMRVVRSQPKEWIAPHWSSRTQALY